MPRPINDRVFGFRAAGIIRILLAADAEEVLEALEFVGIIPEHEHDPVDLPNSPAKLAEAESLLKELTSIKEAMDNIQSQMHAEARAFSANRTRAQALADVIALDAFNALYGLSSDQWGDFSQLLAFSLRLFTENALAAEKEREEPQAQERETTTTI